MLANALYLLALVLVSPIVAYRMIRHGRYRRGARQKIFGLSASEARSLRGDGNDECLWIHAVSVGEVNLLSTLIGELRSQGVATKIVISTSTDSGYDLAVERFGHADVFFCPLDFSWAVKRTLCNLRPSGLVLAELELWPNLIRAATDWGCPVMVANGRLSSNSAARYVSVGKLLRPTFQRLTWVGCQDQDTANRFTVCGAPRTEVTGSIKFDGVSLSRENHEVQSRWNWSAADPWHQVWCMGSTQAGEEALALRVYRSLSTAQDHLRLMIVPRHPERFDAVARLIQSHGFEARRRSELETIGQGHPTWPAKTVLLIDTVGELRHWWGVANIATVGGSFGDRGGQNMLEPAGYGCAVSFGPNTKNFKDIAGQLLEAGGAVRVHDERELTSFVERCLTDRPAADSLGLASARFVKSQQGATLKTARAILAIVGTRVVETGRTNTTIAA